MSSCSLLCLPQFCTGIKVWMNECMNKGGLLSRPLKMRMEMLWGILHETDTALGNFVYLSLRFLLYTTKKNFRFFFSRNSKSKLHLIFKILIILDKVDIFAKACLMLNLHNIFWYVGERFEIRARNACLSLPLQFSIFSFKTKWLD